MSDVKDKVKDLKITYTVLELEGINYTGDKQNVKARIVGKGFETRLQAYLFIAEMDGYQNLIVVENVQKGWV